MYSNRRPYYGLKLSIADFFREPVRYLKESNTQESMMEKPYFEDEYPKMHLKLPDFKFKPREIPSIFGPIADDDPFPGPGLAMIDFGDAKCRWNITNVGYCTEGPVIITMSANYFWHAEFGFAAEITADTIGVSMQRLEGTVARAWDEQDYMLTFPEGADGSVTVCGFASAHVLVSQTFETVVAGMPVGIHLIGGALIPIERGQSKPATLLKSVYGDKGDSCGCITLETNCNPCDSTPIVRWDHVNSAETIGVSHSVNVFIYDGVPPYSWLVRGRGFTLNSYQTTGTTNTLNSDESACGTATITVIDICGDIATGYVRCTTGEWILKGNFCGLGGGLFVQRIGTISYYSIVSGNQKQNTTLGIGGGTVGYYGCDDPDTTCEGPIECASWSCSEMYNSIGPCGDYCCYSMDVPDPCGGLGAKRNGNCIETKTLNYYEWECAP